MNRRPFIKLLGANLIGIPLLGRNLGFLAPDSVGSTWLACLVQEGQIESISSFWAQDLPQLPKEVQSGEFIVSSKKVYYYQQRQYCFQLFEKTHPVIGQLELMVAFWKKQKDGTWQKISTLNSFGIEALTRVIDYKYTPAQLLPLSKEKGNAYSCEAGLLQLKTRIGEKNAVYTEIQLTNQSGQSWKKEFSSSKISPSF